MTQRHQTTQVSRTMTSKDKSVAITLDAQDRLSIRAGGVLYPLNEVDALALANLLHNFYGDIAQAARPFTGVEKSGRKTDVLQERITHDDSALIVRGEVASQQGSHNHSSVTIDDHLRHSIADLTGRRDS